MIVIDASVWIALTLPTDAHYAITLRWARSQFSQIRQIYVPSLFLVEFASALVRRSTTPDRALEGVQRLQTDPMFIIVPVDEGLIQGSVRIATEQRLRAADAVYVALAQQLALPLITWDNEQRQRASGIIEAFTPGEALARDSGT